MKTCIIDNHTKHLADLAACFSDAPEIISKETFDKGFDASQYALIVLSGGSGVPTVLRHPDFYKGEMALVRDGSVPVLGICLGAEIIAKAFGGEVKELDHPHSGLVSLDLHDGDLSKLFPSGRVNVVESHSVGVVVLPACLAECASSSHSIEIFRHVSRPIIGVQFHPEMTHNKKLIEWMLHRLGL